jgi:AAHS family 4-hydroxybenzoate transporter-like MFS transporter
VGEWLRRIEPAVPISQETRYVVSEEAKEGVPIVHLFHEGRASGTVLLWTTQFLNLVNLYFLSTWLPTIAREAGLPVTRAVLVGTMFQTGGAIGSILLGWPIRRFGFFAVLTVCFLVASVSIGSIGRPGLSLALLFVVVFVAGFGILGGQGGVNALAATFYPTDLRSTGVGAALGVGRIGSIVGPTLAELMRPRWSTEQLFLAAAAPAMVSALVMLALRVVMRKQVSSA